MLSLAYNIMIDNGVGAPGYRKYVANGLNDTDKWNLLVQPPTTHRWSRLYFPEELCIFRYFPVAPSGTTLSYSTRKWRKNEKGTPKECVSTSATADIHTYLLCTSAIKFTLLQEKNHASTSVTVWRCLKLWGSPRQGGRDVDGGCCVFVWENGGGRNCLDTYSDLQPAYSTNPVSPAPIIQYLEENLTLRTPPPPDHPP